MAVQISVVESYKYYGRCLKMANENLEILITLDLGPRIISFAAPGGENIFFNDEAQAFVSKGEMMESVFGEGAEYHFYGGHRMWLAPQLPVHTNVPDNDPVDYTLIENGVVLNPKPQPINGMQPCMKVVMDPEKAEIDVTVSYTNISDEPRQYATWQISQMAPGGVSFMTFAPERPPMRPRTPGAPRPQIDLLKPLKPNSILAMFISGPDDPRFDIDNRYMTLVMDPENRAPFKLGTLNKEGWAMYAKDGQLFTVRHTTDPDGVYTDGGCSFECYTNAAFLELETLGELKTTQPGESIAHTVTLSLKPAVGQIPDVKDRAAVAEFIKANL